MTVTINAAMEASLAEKAAHEGQNMDFLVETLLDFALEWEAQDRREAIGGIRKGLEAFEQGRYRSLSEVLSDKEASFQLPESVKQA